MAEHIKIKSNGSDDESGEFDKFFPSFIWAVRDFALDLVIDGKTVTEDEYLEHALQLKEPKEGAKGKILTLKMYQCYQSFTCLRKYSPDSLVLTE